MSNLKVQWRREGGRLVGRLLDDPKRRTKIVFVSRDHRGRQPTSGETTEVLIERDTNRIDPHKGALIVKPVFPPDPTALSRDAAKAEMIKMIRAAGVVLGDWWIDVDLPGWKGTIHASRPKSPHQGPVPIYWRYTDDAGTLISLLDADGGYTAITRAIFVQQWKVIVADYARAVRELGEPAAVDAAGGVARVTWKDARGNSLMAELEEWRAFAQGGRIENVHMTSYGSVAARIVMLDGRWILEEADLAQREQCHDGRTIGHAKFDGNHRSYLSTCPDIRAQVVSMLRANLHSGAWHKQTYLAGQLSTRAAWSNAIWQRVRSLRALLDDRFTPVETCMRVLNETRRIQADLAELSIAEISFVDAPDPLIYGEGTPDDSAEVSRLTAENIEQARLVDAEIAALEAEIERLPAKRGNPDLITDVWAELEGMRERLEAHLATCERERPDEIQAVRWSMQDLLSAVRRATELAEAKGALQGADIEMLLKMFGIARDYFGRWLERVDREQQPKASAA